MEYVRAFSGFSVNDLALAKAFYGGTLGLTIDPDESMGLNVSLPSGGHLFIYQKQDHHPADYTMLNLEVTDISAAVQFLMSQGVRLERYDNLPAEQDKIGILRGKAAGMGPDIAWFKDPAGNIIAVLEQ